MESMQQRIKELRTKYDRIVMSQNESNEEDWSCDICLSKESEDDDPLSMCDLCMVVVHPTCYRRELYNKDFDEDEPWFCARCRYLMEYEPHPLSVP